MELAELRAAKMLGESKRAEVFLYEGHAIKLSRERGYELDQEFLNAQMAHAAGLPTPKMYELLRVGHLPAISMDPILLAHPMTAALTLNPGKCEQLAIRFAELHLSVHNSEIKDFPSQKDQLRMGISDAVLLPEDLRKECLDILETLPDDDIPCHGDFHPGNVLMLREDSEEEWAIDWPRASQGNRLADIARTILLTTQGKLPAEIPNPEVATPELRAAFLRSYIQRYNQLHPIDLEQVKTWGGIVSAARLREGIDDEKDRLLQNVEAMLFEHQSRR